MNCSRLVPRVAKTSSHYACARAAICTVVVFSVVQVNAGNLSSSPVATTEADGSPSATTGPTAPPPGCGLSSSGLDDVNRVEQRKVGKGINLYSLAKERSMGAAMAAAVDRQTRTVNDSTIKRYIIHLAQKVVRNSDAQVPFTVKVIESANPTTFSLPGGFLYVDEGLILDVDSEAELVALMAHEIAHVVARHATRFATRKNALDVISAPAAQVIGPAALPARQIGLLPLERKINRQYEFEADLLGMKYQYAAGYDPEAYIRILEKLDGEGIEKRARASRDNPKPDLVDRMYIRIGQSFSPYPPTEQRIARLQKQIPGLLPCRDDYVVDTSEFQEVKSRLGAQRLILRRSRPGESTSGPVLQRRPLPQE